jgi:hypothetical protein
MANIEILGGGMVAGYARSYQHRSFDPTPGVSGPWGWVEIRVAGVC